MRIQSLAGAWEFRQAGGDEWLPATVPGGVHTDLLKAGRIPDPFVADNEKRVQWVAEADWQYRFRFACEPGLLNEDRVWLACDGLDTLATVALNGQELGRTDNMFRYYRWQVKDLLLPPGAQPGTQVNELLITFASPVKFAAQKMAQRALPGVPQAIAGGPYVRKAPCHFGWDWGPQLPPIGVWKDIRLEGSTGPEIDDVHLRQQHAGGAATVTARISFGRGDPLEISGPDDQRNLGRPSMGGPDPIGRGDPLEISGPENQHNLGRPYQVMLRLTAPDGEVLESQAAIAPDEAASLSVTVTHPQLWWPNGYGAQPLYQVEVAVLEAGGGVTDRRTFQIGLRTIELRQQEDAWGRSFVFLVNGVSIFAKGSNWIPADSFPTRLTQAHLEGLIRAAAETHHNMLRVWGGGFYEDERFYDLCDRYGILVWQEFIFSCSIYPLDDPEFLENVRLEAQQNLRRLRHRASLALWCGNNEMEWGWVDWGWNRPDLQDLKAAYDRFFHHTLPEWCAVEDPDTAYWPSSPSSDTPFENPNGQRQGDAHYWDVWHGRKPFTAYRGQFPRFMSEFGFQALPPLATIRTYADEADWNMTSYIMEQHQKNASGNSLMVGQMLDTFRLPKDFETLVYLSMALQAEGIRYGVEHWRRHPDRVAGTLYWQLNDCWPVASWSSLDYFGRWKALHYAARRFYSPLLLSIEDQQNTQSIYVTNDLLEPWEGTVRWWLETLDGRVLESGRSQVEVGSQSAAHVRTLDFSERLTDDSRRELVFIAELMQGERGLALQAAYFTPTKHLKLQDPQVQATVRAEDGQLVFGLTSRSLASLVELALEGGDAVFSDNYFDLPAGRMVQVTCPLPSGWSLEQAQAALRIRSVYDSYAHPD